MPPSTSAESATIRMGESWKRLVSPWRTISWSSMTTMEVGMGMAEAGMTRREIL
jgi:hypothetical protein